MENTTLPKVVTKIAANPALATRYDPNRPLKVAAYCRVSTDEEDQINSYNSQVKYYREKITQNPKWRFVDIYADEGITGTIASKREDFMRMISDCEKGKIDLILTKSVSRYARNVVDSLKYLRMLKAMGIGIYFEEQNINSLTESSETYIGIFSVMAQSESENISANVSWGIRKRMRDGTYACHVGILGYRRSRETGEIYIVPEEADTVRKIYSMYLDGNTATQIRAYMEANGFKTRQGKTKWSNSTILSMLQNEKYVGDLLYQKTFIADPISKRAMVNRGEKDKYLVSNNHPAIIDRDTFMRVQTEMARRACKKRTSDKALTQLGKYSGKYALSEILVCGECGSPYQRRTWTQKGKEKRIYWRCLTRIEHGTRLCQNKGVEEKKLQEAICRALKRGVEESREVYSLIEANLTYAVSGEEGSYDIFSLEKSILEKQTEVSDLVKLSMRSDANVEKYESEIAKIYAEIRVLREQAQRARGIMRKNTGVNEEVKRITEWLNGRDLVFEKYDDVVVRRLVDTIRVNRDDTITLTLKGGVELTEAIESTSE